MSDGCKRCGKPKLAWQEYCGAACSAQRNEPLDKHQSRPIMEVSHEYLSAGDVPGASGDRPYWGCYLCGRSRKEHAK